MHRVTLESATAYARDMLASATGHADKLPERVEVQLAGLDLVVHIDHGELADATRTAFVTNRAAAAGQMRRSRIVVAHPGVDGFSAPARWGEPLFNPHSLSERLAQSGLRGSYFHDPDRDLDQWQFYDPECGIGVELMTSADAFPPWEPGAPLRPFLHWDCAAHGLRLVHAGTLGIDGSGVLLAGAGGAGKSGTVIAGLLHGLDSVGDDYVLVDLAHGVRVHPLYNTLKQDPSGFARLKLQRRLGPPGALNWQGKHQFRIGDITDRPIPSCLDIAALLVPVRGDDKTSFAPISRKEAMIALAPSGIAQMPGERASGFRFFSELTRRLPCYRLSLGNRPEEIAGAISEFVLRMSRPE